MTDVSVVSRFWEDAASIFETASAVTDGTAANLAILMDSQNGMRIVDSGGWTLDALRREYQVETAYSVTRTASSLTVEAQNSRESCTLRKNTPANLLANLGGAIPFHLVRSQQALLA